MNPEYNNCLIINKKLDFDTKNTLEGILNTRRMKRDPWILADKLNLDIDTVIEIYGEDGEFYIQENNTAVIDNDTPPNDQPNVYCNWKYNEKLNFLKYNSKDYEDSIEWIIYLVRNIFEPRGYYLSGNVEIYEDDIKSNIIIKNNDISVDIENPDEDSDNETNE